MTYPHPGVDAWESRGPLLDISIKWFHAGWCTPCRLMEPIIRKLKVPVTVIDVDKDSTGGEYITVIPTTAFYVDGKKKFQHVGVMSTGDIELKIEELRRIHG